MTPPSPNCGGGSGSGGGERGAPSEQSCSGCRGHRSAEPRTPPARPAGESALPGVLAWEGEGTGRPRLRSAGSQDPARTGWVNGRRPGTRGLAGRGAGWAWPRLEAGGERPGLG